MNSSFYVKDLLKFATPIILGHIGIMLIGVGDMFIAGQYSRECLAAIGLAISVANPIMISLLGFQFAISPVLAKKRGEGEEIRQYFFTILVYSLMVSILSCLLTILSVRFVPLFGYSQNLERIIVEYLWITAFSTFGLCLYQGCKEFFQSEEKIFWANLIALLAVVVNLFLNYHLVFGTAFLPELKEAGLAWASLLVRYFMGISLLIMCLREVKLNNKIDWSLIKELVKVGGPIVISVFFEVMAFCSVTLFIGKFAEIQTAANNITLNLASLAFMIPMSIGAALSVKVGHHWGEKKIDDIKNYAKAGLFSCLTFSVLLSCIFLIYPTFLLSLFSKDQEVLSWGVKLIFWMACFQLFDGVQVTLSGVLRGLGDTKFSSIASFIGYWLIGIPTGYVLGFKLGFEAQGFWIGLAISLMMIAVILSFVVFKKLKSLR